MKARLARIMTIDEHRILEKDSSLSCCRAEIDLQAIKKGMSESEGWHHTAIILYTDTVQQAARVSIACIDAINALKDEGIVR